MFLTVPSCRFEILQVSSSQGANGRVTAVVKPMEDNGKVRDKFESRGSIGQDSAAPGETLHIAYEHPRRPEWTSEEDLGIKQLKRQRALEDIHQAGLVKHSVDHTGNSQPQGDASSKEHQRTSVNFHTVPIENKEYRVSPRLMD